MNRSTPTRPYISPLDLSGAFIRRTNLSGVNFENADLRGADCTAAIFRGANFRNARLDGTILRAADLTDAINLTDKQLRRQSSTTQRSCPTAARSRPRHISVAGRRTDRRVLQHKRLVAFLIRRATAFKCIRCVVVLPDRLLHLLDHASAIVQDRGLISVQFDDAGRSLVVFGIRRLVVDALGPHGSDTKVEPRRPTGRRQRPEGHQACKRAAGTHVFHFLVWQTSWGRRIGVRRPATRWPRSIA